MHFSACLDFGGWGLAASWTLGVQSGCWLDFGYAIPPLVKALGAQTAPSGVYLSVGTEPQPRTEPP